MSTARGRITGNLEGCFRIADQPAAIGQYYGARPDFGLIVDITTTRPCRAWAPIIARTERRNFGTTYQASMNLEMVFFLCGRSAAAVRSGPRIPRPRAGCKGPRSTGLSKPDPVLSVVPGNDRGDAGRHAPEATVGKSGMAVVAYTTLGDRHQSGRKLWLARSVHQGIPKGVPRFTEPISPYGGDVHSPARDERNSSPFR